MAVTTNYYIGSLEELRRRATLVRESPGKRHVSMFEDMMTDFIAGVAHGVEGDPQVMARELFELGGDVYGDRDMWVTWEQS